MKSNTCINQCKLVLMKSIHETEKCILDKLKHKTYRNSSFSLGWDPTHILNYKTYYIEMKIV